MAALITGRTLDRDRHPVDGSGFEYAAGGRIAELLAQRVSPLWSQPITKEWVFGLVAGAQTGGEYERGVGVFTPGNSGPPEHIHPGYVEIFDFIDGEFVFRIGGKERLVSAGEKLTVPIGTPHTFRCVGAVPGVVIVETRPAARIGFVIATLFGMAHEGRLTRGGQPKMMQAMVIGSEYADDTVFTNPPPGVALPLARMLAPLGRRLGYQAIDPKYLEESFWSAHVEQPPRGNAEAVTVEAAVVMV